MRYARELELISRTLVALADRYGIPIEEVETFMDKVPMRGLVWEAA